MSETSKKPTVQSHRSKHSSSSGSSQKHQFKLADVMTHEHEIQLQQTQQQLSQLQAENQNLQADNLKLRQDRHTRDIEAYNKGYTTRSEEEVVKDLEYKENMKQGLQDLTLELRMQGCSTQIRSFSGEGSEKFLAWSKDMEKVLTQLGNDDTRARSLTLQTLTGTAADFATREIRNNPFITWDALKTKLDNRYNDSADVAFARQKLRRMTQSKVESVQNYFERLMIHARHAYGDTELHDRFVQQQLVEIFLDGLVDDTMVRRLIRSKPQTLDRALELATSEQLARKAFDLRRGNLREEVDMDIDSITTMAARREDKTQGVREIVESVLDELLVQKNYPSVTNAIGVNQATAEQQFIPQGLHDPRQYPKNETVAGMWA